MAVAELVVRDCGACSLIPASRSILYMLDLKDKFWGLTVRLCAQNGTTPSDADRWALVQGFLVVIRQEVAYLRGLGLKLDEPTTHPLASSELTHKSSCALYYKPHRSCMVTPVGRFGRCTENTSF